MFNVVQEDMMKLQMMIPNMIVMQQQNVHYLMKLVYRIVNDEVVQEDMMKLRMMIPNMIVMQQLNVHYLMKLVYKIVNDEVSYVFDLLQTATNVEQLSLNLLTAYVENIFKSSNCISRICQITVVQEDMMKLRMMIQNMIVMQQLNVNDEV
ncbi:hypothetical protein RYX36_009974 [Vicia faba]